MVEQETLQKITDEINRVLDELGWYETLNYRYWRLTLPELEPTRHRGFKRRLKKRDNYAFAYTTNPVLDDEGKKVWLAIKYRVKRVGATREKWTMVKHRKFRHPRKARNQAYKWYCERKRKLEEKGVKL